MNVAVTAAFFLLAVLTTFFRGPGSALALVYLPALLLLNQAVGVELPGVPDAGPPRACIYGILLGGILAGRWPRLRPSPVDFVVALLLLAYIASALMTSGPRASLSVFGSMGLWLVIPYFVVRCTLEDRYTQRETLFALIATITIIGIFALIEFRLWPNTYLLQLDRLGIGGVSRAFTYRRFGFFRAEASFHHPIDLGLSAALVLAAIFILANRSGVTTRNVWVRMGLAMALVASLASASFTPYMGLLGGFSLFLFVSVVRSARRFLTLGVLILISLIFAYTAYVAKIPLPELPPEGNVFERSLWTRQSVIKNAWELAATAGPFGWGAQQTREFGLEGFDNAYLLITTQRGWLALAFWLALPLTLAATVSRALQRTRSRSMFRSALAGFCASIGTMVAMFTVWLGFAYASLFPIVTALAVNAAQAAPRVRPARRKPGSRARSSPWSSPAPSATPDRSHSR
jgi:hypothetical protein